MTIHEANPFETSDNTKTDDPKNKPDRGGSWFWAKTCPRCNRHVPAGHYPALSRTDNLTYICSDCGLDEGITRGPLPHPNTWPLVRASSDPDFVFDDHLWGDTDE